MKLHLGCGRHYLDGWVNVDVVPHPSAKKPPDVLCLATDLSKFEDNSADEIMAIHLFEHMSKKEAQNALKEWHRVLKPGGKLILEMPDIIKCARNLLAKPDDYKNSIWGLYGNHDEPSEYMYHKYGWSFVFIKPELEAAGFFKVAERPPEWHGKRLHRDFRVESLKR